MTVKKFSLMDDDAPVVQDEVVEIPWVQRVQITIPTTVEMDKVVDKDGKESFVPTASLAEAVRQYQQGTSVIGTSTDPRSYLRPQALVKLPHGKSTMVLRESWAGFHDLHDAVKSWVPEAPAGDNGDLSAAQRFVQTRAVRVIDGRSYVTFDYVDPSPAEDGKRKNVRSLQIPFDSWKDFVDTFDKLDAGFEDRVSRLIAKLGAV